MYQPTRYMVRRLLARFGIEHTMLSIEDAAALERTLASRPTRLVVFESPSNPVLKIADIERITTVARAHNALTVLDNTFAGFHNHGEFDVDLYVHSLTKFAAGHGDVMGGAVIGSRKLLSSMERDFVVLGATLDPHAAFLIQRGLKTYFVRIERQVRTAHAVARFLEGHPVVERVLYPGLASHPQHALAARQMKDFGAVVTFELAPRADPVKFADTLQLFTISASLGSTESLVQPGQLMMPRGLNEEERRWAAVTHRTMRLSIGLEDEADLLADLDRALAAACG